jgi:hypothetical protein
MVALIACSGDGTSDEAQPEPESAPITGTTTATEPALDLVVTLISVQSGDAACYLNVKDASGTEDALPAEFELCPGGSTDASELEGRKVTLERRQALYERRY